MLGEIWYSAQFYARALSKITLLPVYTDPATGDRSETDNAEVRAVLDRVQDPGGGRSQMLGAYGRLQFLAGECYLLVSFPEEAEKERWEIVSTDELRVEGQAYTRHDYPADTGVVFQEAAEDERFDLTPGQALAYRFWRRHPRYSKLADSPMRGVLDLCEELLMLTHAVRARTRSRLAGAGVFVIPEETSNPPIDSLVADGQATDDPFMRALTEAMTTPIADEGSASAVVPVVVRVQGEYVDKLKHISFALGDPSAEAELRMDTIKRIALGLDLPPEILLGVTDANHWTAWQIDEQSWKAHLQPIAQAFCDDLGQAYFRPELVALGIADPEAYSVGFDASAVISHPDRGRDAKELHDRIVISDEALRVSNGFEESDAPDEAEYDRRVGVKLGDTSLAIGGGISAAPPLGTPSAPPSPNGGPAGVQPGPPNQQSARILTAAELMVERARELAGSRLLTRIPKDSEMRTRLRDVPKRHVASVLGKDGTYGAEADALVAGAGEAFTAKLQEWGVHPRVAYDLVRTAEEHAAVTLFDAEPGPLPDSVVGLVGMASTLVQGE